jgi:thiol:disulfide interchange protein DsbC
MKFNKYWIATAVSFFLSANLAHAQETVPVKPEKKDIVINATKTTTALSGNLTNKEIADAEASLMASFPQFSVSDFRESPIPGIYQILTGNNILYYYPGTEKHSGVLVLGEMYNKNGESLTQQSKMQYLAITFKTLDMSSAVDVGPKDQPYFYEITDPDCPYCHAYDAWLKTFEKDKPLHRKLIFMVNPGHPLAKPKIQHIICADNKDEAVKYAYSDALPHETLDTATPEQLANFKKLKTCKEADSIIAQHQELIKKLGANGTPSFVFGPTTESPEMVVGFAKDKIMKQLLNQR